MSHYLLQKGKTSNCITTFQNRHTHTYSNSSDLFCRRKMTSNLTEISDGEGCFEDLHHHLDQDYDESSEIGYSTGGGRVSEIEEEFSGDDINTKHDLESIREVEGGSVGGGDEAVYVAVGRQSEETSMGALVWALDNLVIPSSTAVFLVHVFPQTKYIPTPCKL